MVGEALRRVRLRGTEEGAETLQLALTFPLVFFLVFAIIQLALMGYGVLALTTAAERAAWELPLGELSSACSSGDGGRAEQLVKESILACSFGIDANALAVGDVGYAPQKTAGVTAIARNRFVYADDDSHSRYILNDFYRESIAGDVTYTVTYTLPSLFAGVPGLSGVTVSKTVTRERVQSSRTEIQ